MFIADGTVAFFFLALRLAPLPVPPWLPCRAGASQSEEISKRGQSSCLGKCFDEIHNLIMRSLNKHPFHTIFTPKPHKIPRQRKGPKKEGKDSLVLSLIGEFIGTTTLLSTREKKGEGAFWKSSAEAPGGKEIGAAVGAPTCWLCRQKAA